MALTPERCHINGMTINTSHSYVDNWSEAFNQYNELDLVIKQALRSAAARALVAGGCEEVGSSDINHRLYSEWKINNKDWYNVVTSFVEQGI